MNDKDRMILNKILNYIQEITTFIKGYNKEKFNNDRKTN